MKDIQFWIIMLAAGSLYWNYLLCKKLKVVEIERQNDYKVYLSKGVKMVDDYEALEKNKNKKIKELEEKCEFFKGISERKIKRVDKLTEIRDDLEEKYSNLEWAYDILLEAYNQNALDLHFWNLLLTADRETKRKFIRTGKYKVYSLENGQVVFEVA